MLTSAPSSNSSCIAATHPFPAETCSAVPPYWLCTQRKLSQTQALERTARVEHAVPGFGRVTADRAGGLGLGPESGSSPSLGQPRFRVESLRRGLGYRLLLRATRECAELFQCGDESKGTPCRSVR
eukprot:3756385-Rhodomonas_salina.1